MSGDERDREFYNMLRTLDTLPANMLAQWYRLDMMRKEALAAAIAEGKIGFQIRPPSKTVPPNKLVILSNRITPDPFTFNVYEGQDYKRVELVKKNILTTPKSWGDAVLNTKDLLAWLNKTFPLASAPSSEQVFMSRELSIAVKCSKDLYPEKPALSDSYDRGQYSSEKKRIDEWLVKHNPGDSSNKMLSKIINPSIRPPNKKK